MLCAGTGSTEEHIRLAVLPTVWRGGVQPTHNAYVIHFRVYQSGEKAIGVFVKILVTGGAGYIGGTVAGLLVENGHRAVAFDNLSHGRRDLLPSGVEFIEGELGDRSRLEDIFIPSGRKYWELRTGNWEPVQVPEGVWSVEVAIKTKSDGSWSRKIPEHRSLIWATVWAASNSTPK